MPTSGRPMRSTNSSRPASAFVLLGLVALATLAAALVHGPGLAGLGLIGAYVTPLLGRARRSRTTGRSMSISPSSPRRPMRSRASGCGAGSRSRRQCSRSLWMLVGMGDPRAGSLRAHAFYALAGFALAAVFLVAGLVYGPEAERGHFEPGRRRACWRAISFARLRAGDADDARPPALITLFVLAAATARSPGAAKPRSPAVPVAAALAVLVIVHWAVNFNFEILLSPRRPVLRRAADAGRRPAAARICCSAPASLRCSAACGYLAQGRAERPLFVDPVGGLRGADAGRHPDRALLRRRRLRALDPVRDHGAAARRAVRLRRAPTSGSASSATGHAAKPARSLRPARSRRWRLALTFALEKGWLTVALALMVPGIALIADQRPLPMLRTALRRPRPAGDGADRLGSAHRRQRRRHDADLQLAAVGLWRARGVVLGRRPYPAPARRRLAGAHAWIPRRSCSPRSPPCSKSAT